MTITTDLPVNPCIYCKSIPRFELGFNYFDLEEISLRLICPKCTNSTYWRSWRTDQPSEQVEKDKQKLIKETVEGWNSIVIPDYDD